MQKRNSWLLAVLMVLLLASGCIRRVPFGLSNVQSPTAPGATERAYTAQTPLQKFCADAATYILQNYQTLLQWADHNEIVVIDLNADNIPELMCISQDSTSDFIHLDNLAYYDEGTFYTVPAEDLPAAYAQVLASRSDGSLHLMDKEILGFADSKPHGEIYSATEYTVLPVEHGSDGRPVLPISAREVRWQESWEQVYLYTSSMLHEVRLLTDSDTRSLAAENDTFEELYRILTETYYLDVQAADSAEWRALMETQRLLLVWGYDLRPLYYTNEIRQGTETISPVHWYHFAEGVPLQESNVPEDQQRAVMARWQKMEDYQFVPAADNCLDAYSKAELREGITALWGTQVDMPKEADFGNGETVFETPTHLIFADYGLYDNLGSQYAWKLLRAVAQGEDVHVFVNIVECTQFKEVYDVQYNPQRNPVAEVAGNLPVVQSFQELQNASGLQTDQLTQVEFVLGTENGHWILKACNV